MLDPKILSTLPDWLLCDLWEDNLLSSADMSLLRAEFKRRVKKQK